MLHLLRLCLVIKNRTILCGAVKKAISKEAPVPNINAIPYFFNRLVYRPLNTHYYLNI